MNDYLKIILTAVISVFASSGFWAFLMSKQRKKDAETKLLVGLGYDRIVFLGTTYIDRGWLTQDEYTNFYDYLYLPYKEMNGIPSVDKIAEDVNKLRVYKNPPKNIGSKGA